jgi:ribose transport system permease protein
MKIPNFKKTSLSKSGPLIALLVLVIISTILYPRFLEIQNLLNILRQVSYTGIIALGMTFVIISGGIDLSVGSMTALAGAGAILMLNMITNALVGFSPMWLGTFLSILSAFIVSLFIALSAGFLNGFLITKGRIAPFIVTLGTMAIFRSLTLYIGKAGEFRSVNSSYGEMGMSVILGIPLPVWIFFILAMILSFVLNRTRYGRYVCAVGSNEKVARYSAINVDKIRLISYVIVGFMVGITAVLISARLNSLSSTNAGKDYEMDAIAAVVIGGTAMTGGKGSIWGSVIGAIILGIINNMLNMLGISPYLQGLVKGLVIIGAVSIQRGWINNSRSEK